MFTNKMKWLGTACAICATTGLGGCHIHLDVNVVPASKSVAAIADTAKADTIEVIWDQPNPCPSAGTGCDPAQTARVVKILLNGTPLDQFHDVRTVTERVVHLKVICRSNPNTPAEITLEANGGQKTYRIKPAAQTCGLDFQAE